MEQNVINTATQIVSMQSGDITALISLMVILCGAIVVSMGMMAKRNQEFTQNFPKESD
jgi:hypothetical protein